MAGNRNRRRPKPGEDDKVWLLSFGLLVATALVFAVVREALKL